MKPTNEERRKVAAKLRELPTDVYEEEERWRYEGIDTECYDQTDYYLIHQALLGCLPTEHMHPFDYEELHARLADLIEPEPERTCHLRETDHDYEASYRCDACKRVVWIDWKDNPRPNYCPKCGAKVVE